MRIIKATDLIPVEHPVFLVFGQPGIGKSSLGYSMKDPLVLDFDKGAHRAANRRDTLVIDSWADIAEMMTSPKELEPYQSIVVDTVGRCLDAITADIAASDPKKAPGGNLSQQGWGVLKSRFRSWVQQLRALGKDVLLVAHDKEDKDGDTRIVRPDITGGSYGEVMRVADFVGYLYMAGRDRLLDFSPTDRWVGKNPAQWAPFKLPPVAKAGQFMDDLLVKGREALGDISAESAKVMTDVQTWREKFEALQTADELNAQMPAVKQLVPVSVQAQAAALLMARGEALGLPFDKTKKQFGTKAA